jgi:predicted lipid-binding transport protein (Tim44 family)
VGQAGRPLRPKADVDPGLGMAVGMSLMGMVGNVWQFFALRLLIGFLGASGMRKSELFRTQKEQKSVPHYLKV